MKEVEEFPTISIWKVPLKHLISTQSKIKQETFKGHNGYLILLKSNKRKNSSYKNIGVHYKSCT